MPRNFSGHFHFMPMTTIKNIIFDLGNVLLDIDYSKTTTAFENLGFTNFKGNYSPLKMNTLFEDVETGRISDAEFYDGIRAAAKLPLTDEQIKTAWNALFLDFRTESLAFLEKIAGKYQLYLLSNTNNIHFAAFQEIYARHSGKPNFDDYFTRAYYSHLIGYRKPEAAAYQFVLEDAGLNAAETLFIDDLPNNIEGAKALGINTHLLLPHENIEQLECIQ